MRRYLEVDDAPYLRRGSARRSSCATRLRDPRASSLAKPTSCTTATSAWSASSCAAPSRITSMPSRCSRSTDGRFISRFDEEHARDVVVLGAAHRRFALPQHRSSRQDRLPQRPPVRGDRRVRAGSRACSAAAAWTSSPSSRCQHFDKKYPGDRRRRSSPSPFRGAEIRSGAMDEVTEAMRRIRHVPHNAGERFRSHLAPISSRTLWNQLTGALVLLTGIISSVGLLVGGIGVMNIMLISVTERTTRDRRPQGDGRAQGGHPRAVSAGSDDCSPRSGGALGILIGAPDRVHRAHACSLPSRQPSRRSGSSLGVAMSVGVGLFFGYLSRQSRGESRPHRLPAVRINSVRAESAQSQWQAQKSGPPNRTKCFCPGMAR